MNRLRVNFKDGYRWANIKYEFRSPNSFQTNAVGVWVTIRGSTVFMVFTKEFLSLASKSKTTRRLMADQIRDQFVSSLKSDGFGNMSEELKDIDLLTRLTDLGERFQGIDIQFRRTRPIGWEGTWRIRVLASKNERYDYRVAAFGDSFNDAAIATLAALPESDSAP